MSALRDVTSALSQKVDRDSSSLDFAPNETFPLDAGFGEVLYTGLASVWQRKVLIVAIVAAAFALGVIALFVIPPSYTPEASIRGGFVTSNAVKKNDDKSSPYIGLDLARVIETQSRLLQSQDLALRVVQQLGLEQLAPEVSETHWLPDAFYSKEVDAQENQTERAVARLLSHISVTSDLLRTYLIKVSYAGKDSALAVIITNAFVAEFLRSSNLQTLSQQRSSEEAALLKYLAVYGDKHPKVTRAKLQLAATDELLKQQLAETPQTLLQAAGENVTKATAATTDRRPNPRFVIGLFLMVGLMVGIASALRLERKRWADAFSRYVRPFAVVDRSALVRPNESSNG